MSIEDLEKLLKDFEYSFTGDKIVTTGKVELQDAQGNVVDSEASAYPLTTLLYRVGGVVDNLNENYTGGTGTLMDGANGLGLFYKYIPQSSEDYDENMEAYLDGMPHGGYMGIIDYESNGTSYETTTSPTDIHHSYLTLANAEIIYSDDKHGAVGGDSAVTTVDIWNNGFFVEYPQAELDGLKERYGYQTTSTIQEELANGLRDITSEILATEYTNKYSFKQINAPRFKDIMVDMFETQEEAQTVAVTTATATMDTSY